jgi:hypothetical protein
MYSDPLMAYPRHLPKNQAPSESTALVRQRTRRLSACDAIRELPLCHRVTDAGSGMVDKLKEKLS